MVAKFTRTNPEFTKHLLSKNKKTVKTVIGLLTDYCRLNNIGLAEDTTLQILPRRGTLIHIGRPN